MKPLDRKIVRDLMHMRGQFVAVALVVTCGVASYVSMVSTYRSLLVSQSQYYSDYRFANVFAQLKRAPDSIANQILDIPGVLALKTRVVRDVILDVPGLAEPATGRLVSIPDRQAPVLNDLFFRQGRYVAERHSEEVIASEAFVQANHLQLGDSISAVLNGRWKKLVIVGIALSPEYVYEVRGGAEFAPDNRRFGVLWMGYEALASSFNMEGAFNDVSLTLSLGASEEDVITRLDQILARFGGTGAYGREEQVSHRFLSDEIAQNRVTGTALPAIFLGVASFLLSMVLSRLVGTQRPQIAVLKAFGYSNSVIGAHYLKMALLPVLASVAVGIGLGLYLGSSLTAMYADFYRFPVLRYELEPRVIVMTVFWSLGAAVVGALAAVRQAVTLVPAEAMRPEPPAKYRLGWSAKIGLDGMCSPAVRMIFRSLERRPIKAFITSFGMALAIAMLIVGFYFFDAFNYVLAFQFQNVQREDIMVGFNEPRSSEAAFNLAQLPGVLRSEPFRIVPARLRFEHRSKRTAILGLSEGSSLRRVMDRTLNALCLPADGGLILTTKLAEILGVHPGQTVTVEILEGGRPVRSTPVVRLADELIGISGYMEIHALNRLMHEGGTVSGGFLSVDPLQMEYLYANLKRTPAVSAVVLREAALKSFNDILYQSLAIFTTVLVTFACVIASGMVYNGARIALSERGRDLASLRVLGFTQGEIGVMLLGEQAILTFGAIPLGFAIGYAICSLMPLWLNTELYRMPLVVNRSSYAVSFLVVVIAAFVSGLLVRWRLRHLDLVEVLKTRE
jgi:putative ABC transport system permease protein